jgi:Bacterial Ig-like domain (group 3)
VLGTGTLSGGTATFTTSTLKAGNHTVTADYAGDTNFETSKSKAVKQVVN